MKEDKRFDKIYSLIKNEQKHQHWYRREQLLLSASFKKLCLVLLFIAVVVISFLLIIVIIKLIERPASTPVIVAILSSYREKIRSAYDKISRFIFGYNNKRDE